MKTKIWTWNQMKLEFEMLVVTDLIYGKAIGCQKTLWFEKVGQVSSSLSLVFHFGFLQPFATKTTPTSCIDLDVHDKHVFLL